LTPIRNPNHRHSKWIDHLAVLRDELEEREKRKDRSLKELPRVCDEEEAENEIFEKRMARTEYVAMQKEVKAKH
jgi:hypothetical protein